MGTEITAEDKKNPQAHVSVTSVAPESICVIGVRGRGTKAQLEALRGRVVDAKGKPRFQRIVVMRAGGASEHQLTMSKIEDLLTKSGYPAILTGRLMLRGRISLYVFIANPIDEARSTGRILARIAGFDDKAVAGFKFP